MLKRKIMMHFEGEFWIAAKFSKNLFLFQDMLLGVVGMDVPIESFKKLAPVWRVSMSIISFSEFLLLHVSFHIILQFGVHGYCFAINNNGYVLFHPNFRPTVSALKILPFTSLSFSFSSFQSVQICMTPTCY